MTLKVTVTAALVISISSSGVVHYLDLQSVFTYLQDNYSEGGQNSRR